MTRYVVTGDGAAAWGARLSGVDTITTATITPQPEVLATLSRWIDQGETPGNLLMLESEQDMIAAAGVAANTGKRVFTASTNLGLVSMVDTLYNIPGWRAPFVLVNCAREIAASISSESSTNNMPVVSDNGFLQIHCTTAQEVLDCVLFAYRLAEHDEVLLPVLVNQDHFYLTSKNREAVSIPNATTAKQFVGSYNYETTTVTSDSAPPHANTITERNQYSQFRFETHLAAQRALAVYDELVDEFADFFGRNYPAVEAYRCNDAEFVFVMLNPFASKAKESIDRLRDSGWKVGLLRPRLLQPFPQEKFVALLNGKQAVAVIDQNISMGVGGELHTKLCAALYGKRGAPAILASFIGDLSGRELTIQEFFEMASTLRKAAQSGETPSPSLLLNEGLLRELNKNQA